MTTRALASEKIEVNDAWEFYEIALAQGWTDGLPVLPPTIEKVQAMVDFVKRAPGGVVSIVPPKNGVATIEKIAINCVMAGCIPEYLPIVIAALEAMAQDTFNLNGVQTTVHPCTPLAIVCGPIVKEMKFNVKEWSLGGGARANAAVGRAIRLVLWNIGQAYPGNPSKSTFAHPGRFSFCIAEDADTNPWESFAESQGMPPGTDAVTMFACETPQMVQGPMTRGREMLLNMAYGMTVPGNNNTKWMGEILTIFAPPAARTFTQEKWTRKDVQEFLFQHARMLLSRWKELGLYNQGNPNQYWPKWVDQTKDDAVSPIVRDPKDIHIVFNGGDGGSFNAIYPGWADHGGLAVTKPIVMP